MPAIHDLIGNADVFPILRSWDHFNHAGIAPFPTPVRRAVEHVVEVMQTDSAGMIDLFKQGLTLRDDAAGLMNADADEIAFVKNTAEGLSTAAFGRDWGEGDVIVTADVEYPANVYPWMELHDRHGVKLVSIPEETTADGRRAVSEDKILDAASDPKCKMVALSHVQWASGQRMDLAKIGAFCRGRGVIFCVDAIQSLGVAPVDVREMNIDYLAAGSHKWLMGGPGMGFFYCRKELLPETRPVLIGAGNVVNPMDWGEINYTLQDTAAKFECGSPNLVGLHALKASVGLLLAAGAGAIGAQVATLLDRLIEGAVGKGYTLVTPESRAGAACFTTPGGKPEKVLEVLRGRKIEVAAREGRLRVSPHFYNTVDQMDRLVEFLP